jgi:hypothetical protein
VAKRLHLGLGLLFLTCGAVPATASCVSPNDLDRGTLVETIASTMIVIDAVVEEPFDSGAGKGELLRTIRTYVGAPQPVYRINRAVVGGAVLWSSNDEFHRSAGERVLEVLRPANPPLLRLPPEIRRFPMFAPAWPLIERAMLQLHVLTHDPARGYEQIGCERYFLGDDNTLLADVAARARAIGRYRP